jgi:hypothetical protein
VLPRKFDIDKRRAHLSTLVLSGQMTREAALEALKEPVYPEKLLLEDRTYSIKKLELSAEQFDAIMTAPTKTFLDYRTSRGQFAWAKKVLNSGRRLIG